MPYQDPKNGTLEDYIRGQATGVGDNHMSRLGAAHANHFSTYTPAPVRCSAGKRSSHGDTAKASRKLTRAEAAELRRRRKAKEEDDTGKYLLVIFVIFAAIELLKYVYSIIVEHWLVSSAIAVSLVAIVAFYIGQRKAR